MSNYIKTFFEKLKIFGNRHTVLSHAVLGGLIGYLVIHPIGMMMTGLMHHHDQQNLFHIHGSLSQIKNSFPLAFSLKMLPWSIIFALIGIMVGVFYGNWINYVLKLLEKKAARLNDSECRYRTLVESSSDSICHLDLKGNFIYMNPAGLRQNDLTLVQVKKLNCRKLVEPVYKNVLLKALVKAKDGTTVRFQHKGRTKRGMRWFESTVSPIKDEDGKIESVLRISRDITEHKAGEKELKSSVSKLRTNLWDALTALASLAEKKVPHAAGHQDRVSHLACAIATEMGLSKDQIEGIRVSGIVHDVGMMNVPTEILTKPGNLTKVEFELVKLHPTVGRDILKTIDFPWPVAKIVYQHHERLDGSGYPKRLIDKDIMLEAKILAVADTVEAICSNRPHRASLGIKEAIKEIEKKKGIYYDPRVVDVCIKIVSKKEFTFSHPHLKNTTGRATKKNTEQEEAS